MFDHGIYNVANMGAAINNMLRENLNSITSLAMLVQRVHVHVYAQMKAA